MAANTVLQPTTGQRTREFVTGDLYFPHLGHGTDPFTDAAVLLLDTDEVTC